MNFIEKLEKAYSEATSRYYHGSPKDHGDSLKVLPYGQNPYGHDFGGIFLSKESHWGHIGIGENYWYFIDLRDSDILKGNDLYYHHDPKEPEIAKVLDRFNLLELSDDDLDIVWDILCDKESNEDVLEGWQTQTIQGQLAKSLGYKAFESPDERGVAYLLVGPRTLKKDQ